jgi:hypothetical protein
MSLIDRLLKELFPAKEKDSAAEKEVLVKEMIERSHVFERDYQVWKEEGMHKGLIAHLGEKVLEKAADPNAEVNYFAYRDSQSNGFYFHGEQPWSVEDYQFFIQHLIELLKAEEYHVNNSLREVTEENNQLKTVERFYLKPKLKFRREAPYQQLYGNVVIEHRIIEEQTNWVKLMANVYHDRNFQEAKDFEELMKKILLS